MPFQKGNQLGKGNKGRKASKKTKDKLSKSIEKAYKKGLIFGFQKGHKGYKNEGQFKKGNKPWNYVAGKSIPRRISNPKWIEKAKECYKRDNWSCQDCGKKGGKINAHHMNPYITYPELEFELDNLITLCIACHNKAHGGRR